MPPLYRLDATAADVAARFHADPGHDPWEGGAVTPGGFVPVVVTGRDRRRHIVPRLWGVPPPPTAALQGGPAVAHVRNLESPFWIGTLRHSEYRCLVPVTSFQRSGHRVSLAASRLFAFAGIWRDSEVASFAILSCDPNRLLGSVGSAAMPVILHAEDHERWLCADWKSAQQLVTAFPSQLMQMTPMRGAPEASSRGPVHGGS